MFDEKAETERLKQQTRIIRKKTYKRRKSRLDRYKGELLALQKEGCTTAELQRWLRGKRIKVVHSTVARWLQAQHG
ncbi:hypothetical protein I6Y99_005063 [Vibrio parahaemolyticus]|uniref:Transposase n=1 Tax=Vibrio anguillarum TaxID=55601 RepID=A0A7U6FUD1_VIBAN|nr:MULTISPECIES: hypothetical protein [Vibrionaceae]HAT8502448.1 hypothetical protein [Vibrio vulnificus]ANS88288.1 hypothetical protein VSVS12_04590 [Vibrio scophthalmi]AZS27508.1 hypothetical protein DYL72_21595 [Vibrio anguillarum]AZS27528.1 hypothetical protein DYL72_21705 [Vibrio anguillarum]AZS27549.1 hypothetical protein DYL72_21810 [Vibrio anguillarum]